MSWVNDRGGSGTATGTTSWLVSNIALLSGVNVITVTARDAANNTSTDTLTVTYTPGSDTTRADRELAHAVGGRHQRGAGDARSASASAKPWTLATIGTSTIELRNASNVADPVDGQLRRDHARGDADAECVAGAQYRRTR